LIGLEAIVPDEETGIGSGAADDDTTVGIGGSSPRRGKPELPELDGTGSKGCSKSSSLFMFGLEPSQLEEKVLSKGEVDETVEGTATTMLEPLLSGSSGMGSADLHRSGV
jgi:hypothetical protein